MSTPSEKREMMEQNRKNWMRDRDLNMIQSQCYDEIKKNNNIINKNDVENSFSNHNKNNDNGNSTIFQRNEQNEMFLSMMTNKLSNHIRTETRKEFLSNNGNSEWIKEKMDQYLEGELSTHTCKICFELMTSPCHTPILFFPCGHTFCTSCVDNHLNDKRKEKRNDNIKDLNKQCPYCRSIIHSKAINLSLKDLIEQFVMQRKNIECGIDYDDNKQLKNLQVDTNLQMLEKYKSCKMRKSILKDELQLTMNENDIVLSKSKKLLAATNHLKEVRKKVEDRIFLLKEEIDLIDMHLLDQNNKKIEVDIKKEALKDKINLLENSLETVEKDYIKYDILTQEFRKL